MGSDEHGLRPATVEELAAAERAIRPSRSEKIKRPVLIAIATVALLAAGVTAFALSRAGRQPTFQPPLGAAAPFGIGYVDGFGEHTPTPTPSGKPSWHPPKTPTFVSHPTGTPAVGLVGSSSDVTIFVDTSPTPDPTLRATALSAVYWATTEKGRYQIYVWVHNDGAEPAPWQITVQLPRKATITRNWETESLNIGRDTWQFTPAKGTLLSVGATYLFAFEGRHGTGPFRVYSCSVNGVSCTPYE